MEYTDTSHHRMNERLKAYWETLRAGRVMPLERDIVLDDLKDIWDDCFLVAVRDGKFSYNYLGPNIIEAFGDDLTGREIAETLLFPHPQSLVFAFKTALAEKKPLIDASEFTNSLHMAVKYRSCILPLAGHDSGPVAFLLGA